MEAEAGRARSQEEPEGVSRIQTGPGRAWRSQSESEEDQDEPGGVRVLGSATCPASSQPGRQVRQAMQSSRTLASLLSLPFLSFHLLLPSLLLSSHAAGIIGSVISQFTAVLVFRLGVWTTQC